VSETEQREPAGEKLAPMKAQVYKDPRPKEHFDGYHARVRRAKPNFVYELVRVATSLYAWTFFRTRSVDAYKVPYEGPVILAPNHFSFMDHFFTGAGIRRRVQFMAKSQLFAKGMQWIYNPGGVFPVRRGVADEEAFITAHAVLSRGGPIVMYCEGGRSRTGELSEKPKRGIGRLALESGATVVPVAIHGSSRVRNWKHGKFPKVVVQYGDPVRWDRIDDPTRDQQQAVADEIFTRIRALYDDLDGRLREQGGAAAQPDG
jgi:1-acyl-sn-glycerol-3-phosphate acyltransferase